MWMPISKETLYELLIVRHVNFVLKFTHRNPDIGLVMCMPLEFDEVKDNDTLFYVTGDAVRYNFDWMIDYSSYGLKCLVPYYNHSLIKDSYAFHDMTDISISYDSMPYFTDIIKNSMYCLKYGSRYERTDVYDRTSPFIFVDDVLLDGNIYYDAIHLHAYHCIPKEERSFRENNILPSVSHAGLLKSYLSTFKSSNGNMIKREEVEIDLYDQIDEIIFGHKLNSLYILDVYDMSPVFNDNKLQPIKENLEYIKRMSKMYDIYNQIYFKIYKSCQMMFISLNDIEKYIIEEENNNEAGN